MGYTAWTCAHKRKKKLLKKKKKKSIKVNWCNPALLLKSKEHHRGNLGLTLFLFDVFRAVFLFYYYCCFPLSLFYFFLLVRSFSAVKYIYIFQGKLEHLRDTENETLRGNGKCHEIGVLTLPKSPFLSPIPRI